MPSSVTVIAIRLCCATKAKPYPVHSKAKQNVRAINNLVGGYLSAIMPPSGAAMQVIIATDTALSAA